MKFAEAFAAVVQKVRNDIPVLGSWRPTVFAARADGVIETANLSDMARLAMLVGADDTPMETIKAFVDHLAIARKDEYTGAIMVVMAELRSVDLKGMSEADMAKFESGEMRLEDMPQDTQRKLAANVLSFKGFPIEKTEEKYMLLFKCEKVGARVAAVSAEPVDVDKVFEEVEKAEPAQAGNTFQFGKKAE